MLHKHDRVERGASAILVAMSLLVILGFAAIAIDYGLGVNERRLDQNSVDTATLSGGVELIVGGGVQSMVDTIKAYVNDNLGRTVTDAEWAACTDPGALSAPTDTIPGIVDGSNCISLGTSSDGIAGARIRARVPDQTTPTVFAKLLGSFGLVTDAVAEIELVASGGASGAFPAGVFSGAGAGDFFCIKTGTSGQQSCGDPSTGDFGNFNPYFYTELSPANPSSLCTSGNQVAPLSRSMADGLDHFLGISTTPVGNRVNGDDCPQFPGPLFPNQVDSGGGNSTQDVTNGLIKGGSYDGAFTGRLAKNTWGDGPATVFGVRVDNRPLWSYIQTSVLDAAPSPPTSCYDAAGGPTDHTDSTDTTAEAAFVQAQQDLQSCLADPNAPDGLLHDDLYQSPRLTIVPRYWESTSLPSNSCCYNIKGFVPVFIDGIWSPEGPQWTCSGGVVRDTANGFCKHEPGRSGTLTIGAPGQQRLTSAGAYVLNCALLPGLEDPAEKCKKVETSSGTTSVFVNLFLVR